MAGRLAAAVLRPRARRLREIARTPGPPARRRRGAGWGISFEAAAHASRIELLRQGLQLGEVSEPHLPDVPVEIVAMQSPRPGEGATSPRVDLLVSAGPRETAYVMPNLVGLSDVEAQRRLDSANLHRKITYQSAPQWPHATVISQIPAPGTRFLASATAELTVAN